MDWSKLLSDKRYVANSEAAEMGDRPMTPFQTDIEKIIYTASFRRLQGKTQVYPLPRFDYLRTRLTHTNEVAFIGKVMARNIGIKLFKEPTESINAENISDIVYAACLVHDLGNPAFGHIGEEAIRAWFIRNINHPTYKELLKNEEKKNDFLYFDGNAQSFRIATRISSRRDEGGMRLTYATIGAFTKYPFSSKDEQAAKKKFGYMWDDAQAASTIFDELGMNSGNGYWRHPLAYIVEAADDVAYLTTDIDDAHRMGMLKRVECEDLLLDLVESGKYKSNYKSLVTNNDQDKVSFLRSLASATLINEVVKVYLDNAKAIEGGEFTGSLIERSAYADKALAIRRVCSESVYTEINKIQLEAAGFNVILGLMDMFYEMLSMYIEKGGVLKDMDKKDSNLYHLLPRETRGRFDYKNVYRSTLLLLDYISGLTDRFALDLFQRLSGHSTALGKMG